MAVLNVSPVFIPANTERLSATRNVPQRASSAIITLVDGGTQWPATVDNTRHIKIWGIQLNRGAAWVWWLFQGDPSDSAFLANGEIVPRNPNPDMWLAFGSRSRNGSMPSISISAADLGEAAGFDVRLGIITDAAVTLGANVTVT